MNDELLNGTNRVVLDGVMTEKECERILHLAKVSRQRETGGLFGSNGGRTLTSRLVSDRLQDPLGTATKAEGLRTRLTKPLRV